MTTTTLRIISGDDIRAIRVECRNCHATVSLPIQQLGNVPMLCPGCRRQWTHQRNAQAAVESFLNAMRVLGAQSEDSELAISFEIAPDTTQEKSPR